MFRHLAAEIGNASKAGNESAGQHTFQDLSARARCGNSHANSRARFSQDQGSLIARDFSVSWGAERRRATASRGGARPYSSFSLIASRARRSALSLSRFLRIASCSSSYSVSSFLDGRNVSLVSLDCFDMTLPRLDAAKLASLTSGIAFDSQRPEVRAWSPVHNMRRGLRLIAPVRRRPRTYASAGTIARWQRRRCL